MININQVLVELLRLSQGDETTSLFQGTYLNTNPRHYKYFWHVAILDDNSAHASGQSSTP